MLIRVGRYEEAAASIEVATDCARKSGSDECVVAVKIVGMVLDGKRDPQLAPAALAELKRLILNPVHRGLRADLVRSLADAVNTLIAQHLPNIPRYTKMAGDIATAVVAEMENLSITIFGTAGGQPIVINGIVLA